VDREETITRDRLIELLNEDLAREYQAIVSYVIYSKVLKGAAYMNIAAELEVHAGQELAHSLTICEQIDYLGGDPTPVSKPVRTSKKAEEMLRFDLENENETVRNYRQRIRQAEALGEYALAEDLRQILVEEQDHQISLATALGIDVPAEGLGRQSGKATQIAEVKQLRSAAEIRHDAAVKANATRKATRKG
jgi:bacterioferritin